MIHPPIEGLSPKTSTELIPFWNLASTVAGLQVHATTPEWLLLSGILPGKAKKINSIPTLARKYRVKVD